MSPGQGPTLFPSLCIFSGFWLNRPKPFLPNPSCSETHNRSICAASSATFCCRRLPPSNSLLSHYDPPPPPSVLCSSQLSFLFFLRSCFLIPTLAPCLSVLLMRRRDRKGTGLIVERRTCCTTQTHTQLTTHTLLSRHLWHQLNDWQLKGKEEFPHSL